MSNGQSSMPRGTDLTSSSYILISKGVYSEQQLPLHFARGLCDPFSQCWALGESVRYPGWPEPVVNISLAEVFTVAILDLKPKFCLNPILRSGVLPGIGLTSTKPASTAL